MTQPFTLFHTHASAASHVRDLHLLPSTRTLLEQLNPRARESEEEAGEIFSRIAWARIAEPGDSVAGFLIQHLGPIAALKLLISGTTATAIHKYLIAHGVEDTPQRAALSAALKRWSPRLDRTQTEGDLQASVSSGVRVLTPSDEGWPVPLADLEFHAPNLLWVRGDANLVGASALAIVGARASTSYGEHVTNELVDWISSERMVVLSGAAYGIDAVAHRAALSFGLGTVAVLAGGVDRPYPAGHAELLRRIEHEGAVCSEMIPGAAPTRWRFLQRNRLIAALSGAVVVTEAGRRSGSMNTAGHAAQLGRALGAVPGPITAAASAGCHRLIQEYGAALITSPTDLRALLGIDAVGPREPDDTDAHSADHKRVVDALPLRGKKTTLEIARASGMSVEDVRGILAELELMGAVVSVSNGGHEVQWKLAAG